MALGYKRRYNNAPQVYDPDFAGWLMTAVQDLQGPTTVPLAPQVTTVSHPGSVLVAWNEQNQATAYACYETSTATQPPGVPFAIVPANMAAQAGAIMRSNLNDTTVRYYSVVTITQYGRSAPSTPVPGAALSTGATVIPVSDVGLNQNGVGGGTGGGGGLYGVKPGVLF